MGEEDSEKRIARLLGDIPDRSESIKKTVGYLGELSHYYLDRFGPFLPREQREKWAKLTIKTDIISIDAAILKMKTELLKARIRTEVLSGKKRVTANKKEVLKLIESIEKESEKLAEEIKSSLQELLDYIERWGIE